MKKGNYEFFWSGPFSQWYPCTFDVDGIKYNCAEQYMMAEKARLFGDEDILQEIMKVKHPRDHKSLGRKIKGFDNDVWESKRESIVYDGNFHKFSQNPKLKKLLLDTAPSIMVEASPFDKIWGIGLEEFHPDAMVESKWKGLNLLGYILTDLRNDFINLNEILQGYE